MFGQEFWHLRDMLVLGLYNWKYILGWIYLYIGINVFGIGFGIVGFWNLNHPDHVTKKWEIFIIYNIVNWFYFYSMFGTGSCH